MREFNVILTIAYRDLVKLLRDPPRIVFSFMFPVIFIAALGGSLKASLGSIAGFDFLVFVFTGVFAQTMFSSTAQGIISLIEDRESDFSQEIFVSPISRYSIVFGKIIGETLVALPQGIAVVIFGLIIGVRFGPVALAGLVVAGLVGAVMGGTFGVLVLANLRNQRSANQIFPFLIFPQFFLSGAFTPVKKLPVYLDVFSRLSPMRYAVDFTRNLFYVGRSDASAVNLANPEVNLAAIAVMSLVFLVVGTLLFVRRERNR